MCILVVVGKGNTKATNQKGQTKMNTIDIKNIEVKFNEYGDASRITFENKNGEKCGYIDLGNEAGFITEDEALEIEGGEWIDCFDDIYGEDEQTWEAEANKQLEDLGVKLGAFHDEPNDHGYYSGYYELESL